MMSRHERIQAAKDSLIHALESLTLPSANSLAAAELFTAMAMMHMVRADQDGRALAVVERYIAEVGGQ